MAAGHPLSPSAKSPGKSQAKYDVTLKKLGYIYHPEYLDEVFSRGIEVRGLWLRVYV